jgi:hypothetical protein
MSFTVYITAVLICWCTLAAYCLAVHYYQHIFPHLYDSATSEETNNDQELHVRPAKWQDYRKQAKANVSQDNEYKGSNPSSCKVKFKIETQAVPKGGAIGDIGYASQIEHDGNLYHGYGKTVAKSVENVLGLWQNMYLVDHLS